MFDTPRPVAELIDFLHSLGTAEIDHSGHDFLTHLKAVHDVLDKHDAGPELAAAGLFHSIYGTEKFQGFSLPLTERARVRSLIGERAEFVAWLNCIMDRATFDAAICAALAGERMLEISDRDGNPPIELSIDQLRDLATVHLFDWLEQVERSEFGWGYRREAYREMATLVGPDAEALYEDVFSREPSKSAAASGS
ncbi:MAG: hypothetical protein OXH19_13590 [Chloroflexi bacterium]|nr:hypothetical protein [Chloroflexota bacterium]MCY3588549.1 hypothetical protein [Chloroflexota bacterium]MCY3685593.1 hypothetical protein [Chloroflexota bacterium]MDE2708495.1 hypothetical protein [Chloroflexota bacterium]